MALKNVISTLKHLLKIFFFLFFTNFNYFIRIFLNNFFDFANNNFRTFEKKTK